MAAEKVSSSSSIVDISNPVHLLSPSRPFVNFDLGLTDDEKNCLEALEIDSTGHYENYGDLELLLEEVTNYIISLGKENEAVAISIANIVIKVINKILTYTRQETAWITLRAFTPVAAFKEPRWHADRFDYPPTGEQYKGAVTFKGAGTLFYNASLEERARLEPMKQDKKLLDNAMDKSLVVSADVGQGTMFIVGASYAPFHSEPDIKSPRLFLAVMPGSREQIKKVYIKTPEQTIMPLLLAAGFYCYFVGPQIKDTFKASPYEDTEIIVFNLSKVLGVELLEVMTSIVQSYEEKIQAELMPDDEFRVKFSLPAGGAIIINDISWFFSERASQIQSEQDISLILQEYASLAGSQKIREEPLIEEALPEITKVKTPFKYLFNTIPGKNTSGLFKPHSKMTRGESEQTHDKPTSPSFSRRQTGN